MARGLLAAAVVALAVGGCGVGVPDFSGLAASGDKATFILNGDRVSVAQSGEISVSIEGVPELTYSGPVGCEGRYFTADDSDLYFHYGARDAYMLVGNQLYHFATGPRHAGGQLIWSREFGDRKITALVSCPLPR